VHGGDAARRAQQEGSAAVTQVDGILHVYSTIGMKGQFWVSELERRRRGEGGLPPRFDSVENTDIEKFESDGRLEQLGADK